MGHTLVTQFGASDLERIREMMKQFGSEDGNIILSGETAIVPKQIKSSLIILRWHTGLNAKTRPASSGLMDFKWHRARS